MQTVVVLAAFLLVAGVSAEQPQEVSSVQTGPAQTQPSHVVGHTSSVEGAGSHQHQQHFGPGAQMVSFEQPMQPAMAPHYFSPSGMIQVVGQQGAAGEHQQAHAAAAAAAAAAGPKPTVVRHYAAAGPEQYGQPESAALPPNYKPFGSWGLYIGGNPADGYYSNYYKALSTSVADKQSAGAESSKPTGSQSFVSQASGFGAQPGSPFYKQGPAYPAAVYGDNQAYPYGEYYTPADLNSGSRVQVQSQASPSVYSTGFASDYPSQPQQPGAAAMYYADSYAATKKAAPGPQAFAQKEVQAPASPAKGYYQQQQQQQQRMGYAYAAHSAYQAPVAVHQASAYQTAAQPQVVAYPVPVGSQLVGSQPGVEGAFQPYGVHGFTRYAVKPTVVGAEQTYYHTGVHSAPASQFPAYKQQFAGYQQPLSFYGYPLSQLHYSSGAVTPAFGGAQGSPSGSPAHQGPPSPPQATFTAVGVQQPGAPQGATVVEHPAAHGPAFPVEAASSDKSETNSEADKQQVNKPQQQ